MSQIDNRRKRPPTDPRYIGVCLKCGRQEWKRKMWTILVRYGSYGRNTTVGWVCDACMTEMPKSR